MPADARPAVLFLLAGACATPFQQRAAQLDVVRLDVTARSSDGAADTAAPIETQLNDLHLSDALRIGIGESIGRIWLPFAVELHDESPAAAVIAVHGGPARMWQSHDGAVLLDWPIELEFQDEDGTTLLSRSVSCVDRVVFPVDVLVSASLAVAPAEVKAVAVPASAPIWPDPQRAYESLARWCGRTVVETVAAAAR